MPRKNRPKYHPTPHVYSPKAVDAITGRPRRSRDRLEAEVRAPGLFIPAPPAVGTNAPTAKKETRP